MGADGLMGGEARVGFLRCSPFKGRGRPALRRRWGGFLDFRFRPIMMRRKHRMKASRVGWRCCWHLAGRGPRFHAQAPVPGAARAPGSRPRPHRRRPVDRRNKQPMPIRDPRKCRPRGCNTAGRRNTAARLSGVGRRSSPADSRNSGLCSNPLPKERIGDGDPPQGGTPPTIMFLECQGGRDRG